MRKIYLLAIAIILVFYHGATALASSTPNLIKGSGPSVYYRTDDGKRFVFPNQAIYRSWYLDFTGVHQVSDSELAKSPIAGSVTYRPGSRLVKLTSSPKVYVVSVNDNLRWVKTEDVASSIFGDRWQEMIDDLPASLLGHYNIGAPIAATSDYHRADEQRLMTAIQVDKTALALAALKPKPRVAGAASFSVEVDDNGFYPNTIAVVPGESIRITFKMRESGLYFNGLDIRSALFTEVSLKAGQEASVDFLAPDNTTEYYSYWPASNMRWQTGKIIVE